MSFVFYDTETTGTKVPFDQILQFAAIRTDSEFNEIDRFEIRCKLQDHVVPAPMAMHITGVTAARLTDVSLPSHYEMVRAIREKLLSWSPSIFIGYNSLEFDEPLLRQALYKTLHSPYLTNTSGNSRSDALRAVQATSLFTPDVFKIPEGKKGPSFKLDQIAPLNGFDHKHAHDAMSDVEATIFLCRIVAEKSPEIWSSFMRFSQKSAVIDYVTSENIFCFTDFFFSKPYSAIVTAIGDDPDNGSNFYIYDLSVNPEDLADLSHDSLIKRLGRSPKPIRKLKSNAAPILMLTEDAPDIAAAKKYDLEELERRANLLQGNEELRQRLIAATQSTYKERETSPHVEERIYDHFFSEVDQCILDEFHSVPWENRPPLLEKLQDVRLRELGQRLIHTERPDLMEKSECIKHDRLRAQRILGSNDNKSWLTGPAPSAY